MFARILYKHLLLFYYTRTNHRRRPVVKGVLKSFAKFTGKHPEAVARECPIKKVLLKFRKIHRKIPAPESLF